MFWMILFDALVQFVLWLLTKKQRGQKLTKREEHQVAMILGKCKHAIEIGHAMGVEPAEDE